MPRYAVIDNGVVVGVLGASTPPVLNVPRGRIFVDATELPEIQAGWLYDGLSFAPAATSPGLEARVSKVEADVAMLQTKVPSPQVANEEAVPSSLPRARTRRR